jgi:hypothetical protein
MARGLPAITPVFAGVSSLLHDGVDSFILRDPRDAKTLATMIRTLYQKAEWRSRMGQAAAREHLWNGRGTETPLRLGSAKECYRQEAPAFHKENIEG